MRCKISRNTRQKEATCMSSRFLNAVSICLLCAMSVAAAPQESAGSVLRVCSDPNNLPFSNDRLQGFENKIAELVAGKMNARVEYTWWPQRRGFLRNTI